MRPFYFQFVLRLALDVLLHIGKLLMSDGISGLFGDFEDHLAINFLELREHRDDGVIARVLHGLRHT